ncbi:MAG: TorF family putative porin [Desulfobacca sp.]|uniref:TorF family putative porin n=1 Tax=Desulfobacca sp. TaxID=2067990 RepID=UPI004049774D
MKSMQWFKGSLALGWGLAMMIMVLGWQSGAAQETAAAEPPAAVQEDKPTAGVGVDILSQYVWRGFALSRKSAVLQPSITVGYKGWSLNVWGNLDTNENAPAAITTRTGTKWNETDLTFGYTRDIYQGDILKTLSINLGGIYYAYDGTIYPQGDSFEIYYGLAADFGLAKLAVTGNSEVMHYPGTWLTVGVSRVFDLPWQKTTLEVGNNFVFLFSRDGAAFPAKPFSDPASTKAFSGPLAGQIYATLTIPVHEYVTIAPKVGFWYGLGGDSTQLLRWGSWDAQQNHVYGGLNVTFAF